MALALAPALGAALDASSTGAGGALLFFGFALAFSVSEIGLSKYFLAFLRVKQGKTHSMLTLKFI